MCEKIMKYPEIFVKHFLSCFVPLADDKVPNVRIGVAKILKKVFEKKSKEIRTLS